MSFPPSRTLPPLLHADDLKWHAPTEDLHFWTCTDPTAARWIVKLRGGFYAVRERAFSVIAQALDISCQSSTFLKMPPRRKPWPIPAQRSGSTDVYQLAIWLLDEHPQPSHCDNCPLPELNAQFAKRPYDLEVLRRSRVSMLLDWARGEMLGMLCEMHEPPGQLFTADHAFVQIDNELMFCRAAGADLRDSPWIIDDARRIRPSGLDEAIRLCEQVLSLSDDVYQDAIRMPEGYKPRMLWSVRKQIGLIRPRARDFLEWAAPKRQHIG
ncbi:MAG: hypothetical protein OXC14_00955 [Rhodospirillaceae bacterium]|nr:hypothetical protein [Rhodospirillaceae bacterium]